MHSHTHHPTESQWQDGQGWWCIPWRVVAVAALVVCALTRMRSGQAAEFACAAGDGACLIAAITMANGNGEENTLTLAAGTYTLTAIDNVTDGPNGLPSITSPFPLTLQGAGPDITIVGREASGTPSFRLVHVGTSSSLTLDGLTLQGGEMVGGGSMRGGGIWNAGTLILTKSILAGNAAIVTQSNSLSQGGGLYNAGGTVTVTYSVLTGNAAEARPINATGRGSQGGGLYNAGGTVTVTASALLNNVAASPQGTGTSSQGGGLFNDGGTLLVTNSTLNDNAAVGRNGRGGGLENANGIVILTNSSLAGNVAGFNSVSGFGGGIANRGTLTLINCTLANNAVDGAVAGGGGGLYTSNAVVTLTNCTLVGNSASLTPLGGAGLLNQNGTVWLQNTLLALNTRRPPFADRADCAGPITSLGTNLIGDPTGCTIALLPSDLTGDPGLDAFTDDGTPGHGHFPLLPTSQAIDAGHDAACPPTDQLGQPRVGPCDIGAIEWQPVITRCVGTGAARLRGRVWTTAEPTGLPGVTITLSGPDSCQDTTTTQPTGRYGFRTLGSGTYTVTPRKEGCAFTPPSRTVPVGEADPLARFRGTCLEPEPALAVFR